LTTFLFNNMCQVKYGYVIWVNIHINQFINWRKYPFKIIVWFEGIINMYN
jgi:hypothetical protein